MNSMEKKVKVETVTEEIIKPSSPTPNHLRTVNLSAYDQFLPPVYTVSFIFYSNSTTDPTQSSLFSEQNTTSLKLKASLSETLSRFYPLAGRINKGVSIDCNDEGAVFVDARVDSTLLDLLKSPDFSSLQRFLPLENVEDPYEAANTWPLLLVKATRFRCGGLAIGICISHKIADAASISTFTRSWAAITRGNSDAAASPEFIAAKFFPPASRFFRFLTKVEPIQKLCVTKRFVFDACKIDELKAKAASEDVAEPTRVEAITAFLWTCAVSASNSASGKPSLPKLLNQPSNLRPKIPSVLSENTIGNVLFSSVVTKIGRKSEARVQETVKELRRNAKELERVIRDDGGTPKIGTKIVIRMMSSFAPLSFKTHEPCSVSSWCKLPLYEADFGFGSPIWMTGNVVPSAIENMMILIDSKDGKRIEAWVTLPEQVMATFEQNQELLASACPNPSVI